MISRSAAEVLLVAVAAVGWVAAAVVPAEVANSSRRPLVAGLLLQWLHRWCIVGCLAKRAPCASVFQRVPACSRPVCLIYRYPTFGKESKVVPYHFWWYPYHFSGISKGWDPVASGRCPGGQNGSGTVLGGRRISSSL